jgi:glycolate oxidase
MVVPMSKISEMVKAVEEAAKKYDITIALGGHIADGNIHPLFFKPDRISLEEWPDFVENIVDELIGVAISLGGVGSGEHGVGFLKKHTFMKYEAKSKLEVMRGIKRAFDPNGILNPGKLFE